jgi:hypothetical protein
MQTSRKASVCPPTWFDTQHESIISTCMSLLAMHGGTVRAGAVAKRLGVSPDVVDRLRLAGRLLAMPEQHGYTYPVFQFDGRSVLAGIPLILRTMGDADPWTRAIFLLAPHTHLGSQCPLDALRAGAHADVARLAGALSMSTVGDRPELGRAHPRRSS